MAENDPDDVRLEPTGRVAPLSVEDAYRVLAGLPPIGPVQVPEVEPVEYDEDDGPED